MLSNSLVFLNNTLVALSIAPLEDCYEPGLFPGSQIAISEYKSILEMINKDVVDIILFETMGCYKEIKSALIASSKIKTMKWLSIILKNSNSILDGTSIEKVIDLALEHGVADDNRTRRTVDGPAPLN